MNTRVGEYKKEKIQLLMWQSPLFWFWAARTNKRLAATNYRETSET